MALTCFLFYAVYQLRVMTDYWWWK